MLSEFTNFVKKVNSSNVVYNSSIKVSNLWTASASKVDFSLARQTSLKIKKKSFSSHFSQGTIHPPLVLIRSAAWQNYTQL